MRIRVYSLSAISLGVLSVVIAALAPACASKKDHASDESREAPSATGSLRMALSARAESGTLYRLRNATFNIQKDDFGFFNTLSTESDPLATTIEATLPVGNFFINIQPDFSSGGNFTLEKIENGSSTRVRATLLSPVQQTFTIRGNEETQVGYRFETNGEVVDFGQGRLIITLDVAERAGEARRTVIETGQDALAGLSLRETLDAALSNARTGTPFAADDVYHAIIDSYNSSPGNDASLAHCDDQQTNGQASLNGYPLACPRLEGSQFDNLDAWFPIAFVNRLDLAPTDGANCGQQRIIFANNVFIGNGRMFMIVEAQLPNPTPECGVDSCRPIAEFWSSLAAVNDPIERGNRLRDAFLISGTGPFGPFMNANQLGPDGGQIRTNNFDSSPWTMREFHMQAAPAILPLPHAVREAPNGELWNDLSALAQGEACRNSFLDSISNLQSDNLATFGFPVAPECEDAESPNDFGRHDYASQLASGSGEFAAEIDDRVAGTGLSATDIARRARFAGSCMGCHIESSGVSLGRGVTAPNSNDFVQISEFATEPCFGSGNGTCFLVSEALRTVFLPHRIEVQQNFMNAPSSGCGTTPFPGDAGVPEPSSDAGPGLASRSSRRVQRTLGGQPVVDHPH